MNLRKFGALTLILVMAATVAVLWTSCEDLTGPDTKATTTTVAPATTTTDSRRNAFRNESRSFYGDSYVFARDD